MSTASLPVLSTPSGLSQYLRDIQKFPMLEPTEEYMLAKRYVEHQDMAAAHRLVTSHLRLVVKIAHSFRGYGLPLVDMISEGNIGLMQAVKRFDPEKGFRLSTYAMWWIKASMQEYILRSWSLVKMGSSVAQKKLFYNLNKIKHRLHVNTQQDLRPEEITQIAHELDVAESDLVDMNHRMMASDRSLDAPMSFDGDGSWVDALADSRESHETVIHETEEQNQRAALLARAMATLNAREQVILTRRRLEEPPATLEDLSQEYAISRERVRQIENRAFEKLQAEVRKQLLPPVAA
jgi:RNA polymerase sigma-32 factor